MARITAVEAKRIAGPTIDEIIDDVCKQIEVAAKSKKRELHLHQPDVFVSGGYSTSPEWLSIKTTLEALGFTVEFFYEERQFVNMYTIIKW